MDILLDLLKWSGLALLLIVCFFLSYNISKTIVKLYRKLLLDLQENKGKLTVNDLLLFVILFLGLTTIILVTLALLCKVFPAVYVISIFLSSLASVFLLPKILSTLNIGQEDSSDFFTLMSIFDSNKDDGDTSDISAKSPVKLSGKSSSTSSEEKDDSDDVFIGCLIIAVIAVVVIWVIYKILY